MKRRLPHGQFMIAFSALVGLLSISSTRAPELDYQIHFIGPVTETGEKYLIEGLIDQDPAVQFWIDSPTQSALVRTAVSLDRDALQTSVSPSGLIIGYLGLLSHPHDEPEEQSGTKSTFPEYVDTARPTLDQANFIAAKAAWFAANGVIPNPATDQ